MTLVRINKYISDTGFCSRREADQLVADARVTVNGILAEMGTKVSDTDKVKIDGQILRPAVKLQGEAKPAKKKNVKPAENDSVPHHKEIKTGTRGSARNIKIRRQSAEEHSSSEKTTRTAYGSKAKHVSDKTNKNTPKKK